jgi:tetratricopeptide (TPR) repeat protein
VDAALEAARGARDARDPLGRRDVVLTAVHNEARLLIRLGRLDEAAERLAGLEREALRTGDRARLGIGLVASAEVARRQRDPLRAIELLRRAIGALGEALESKSAVPATRATYGAALLQWGRAAERLGERGEAANRYERAHKVFAELGSGVGTAECQDRLGRLAFADGDLVRAEALLARALSQYEALGSERQLSCRMRLARVVLRAEPRRTWSVVERIEPQLGRLDHRGQAAATLGLRLVRCALDGDWLGWDLVIAEASEQLPPQVPSALGAAWLGWLAGEAAALSGERDRADRALRLAEGVFRVIGDGGVAAEVAASRTTSVAPG